MRTSLSVVWIITVLLGTQVGGPATLWAVEQRGIRIEANRQIIVSALSGDQLTIQTSRGAQSAKFGTVVQVGERVETGARTVAEVLLSDRTVMTLDPETMAQVLVMSADEITIQVAKGTVRVAAAPSAVGPQGVVRVQTPTSQVQTRGGIVRVAVEAPVSKAEQRATGAQVYPTSYRPEGQIAATPTSSELIHVEEGTAEIPGAGPASGSLTLQAGQRVLVQAGRAGAVAKTETLGTGTTRILATTSHTQTPKEGRDYLVALQVNQATQLSKVLTGAAETGGGESDKKSDTKNVINGATAGVNLASNPILVNALFGNGSAASPAGSNPTNSTGAGYGGNNNNGFNIAAASDVSLKVNGSNSLLVFTRKDPVEAFVKEEKTLPRATNIGTSYQVEFDTVTFAKNSVCDDTCLASHYHDAQKDPNNPLDGVSFNPSKPLPENVGYRSYRDPDTQTVRSFKSEFSVAKELVLIGGSNNTAHGGVAPTEKMIVRGASSSTAGFTNLARTETVNGLFPTDRGPANIGLFAPTPRQVVRANSTFVVETSSKFDNQQEAFVGGTLGQYSNLSTPSPSGIVLDELGLGVSHVDGAITATGSNVALKGGVTLDQDSIATIGQTAATKSYFAALGATFTGSLMSVINGPTGFAKLTMQERMLGVYDGSIVQPDSSAGGKALLSVLDAKLVGPSNNIPLIDIASGSHFDRDGKATPGTPPSVTVTSAIVTRSTIKLDGALLEASAPLVALTQGTPTPTKPIMTTTSHFADLAGKATQSLNLNGALVALSAANLVVNGNLLNLNNATAAITGYLFSLNNESTLTIANGSLFKLDSSALTLNGNAFGVFGNGTNTLTINNDLCGVGATCGTLMNSANQPFTLANGAQLKVAGVNHDVVLPNNFNVFAGNGAAAKVNIGADDALFQVKGNSQLTINGVKVQ